VFGRWRSGGGAAAAADGLNPACIPHPLWATSSLQQLHQVPLRPVAVHEMRDKYGVIVICTAALADRFRACDQFGSLLIVALTARSSQPFDSLRIGAKHRIRMIVFARPIPSAAVRSAS
jgi:hypothetical protein